MNERNLTFLQNQLKYTGFGQSLWDDLKMQISKGPASFTLQHAAWYGKEKLAVWLRFTRSPQSDLYFLNSYKAALCKNGQPQPPAHTFYLGSTQGNITCKEAFNLLSGRSVFKDMTSKQGHLYQAWLQLDFKQTSPKGEYRMVQYGKNYGYNLVETLMKFPFKEVALQKERLQILASLQKGNRPQVTLEDQNGAQKVWIEASPRFKTLLLYDHNNLRMHLSARGVPAYEQTKEAAKQSARNNRPSGL
jgi:hypothetical protein